MEAEVSVKDTSDLGHVQNWKVFELWRVFGPLAFGQDMPRLPDIEQNGMREVPNLRSRLACPLRNRPTARCPVEANATAQLAVDSVEHSVQNSRQIDFVQSTALQPGLGCVKLSGQPCHSFHAEKRRTVNTGDATSKSSKCMHPN